VTSALAYRPGRGPLQQAGALPAIVFVWSFAAVAFIHSNPLVLAGAGVAALVIARAAGVWRAATLALRWAAGLAVFVIAVNALVADHGLTVLVRGPSVPLLGPLDVTLEAIVAGAILALRIAVAMIAFAVYSACVDPDRVLKLVRPLARRSALTASLLSRLVPLAAADGARLRAAAGLRGPAAAPVGRLELLRRLVAGSLDRAVDVAATLELRGYRSSLPRARGRGHRSRHDRRFALAGLAALAAAGAAALAGVGASRPYPEVAVELGPAVAALAAGLPLVALAPFALAGRGGWRR